MALAPRNHRWGEARPTLSEQQFADPAADFVDVTGNEPPQVNPVDVVATGRAQHFDTHPNICRTLVCVYADLMPPEIALQPIQKACACGPLSTRLRTAPRRLAEI